VHIAEGILPLGHAAAWAALTVPLCGASARDLARLAREGELRERALVGMAGALIFAFTLFPVPVPVVGVSSHMCATPVLALLVGPRRIIAPAAAVLLLQALFFAHGGLSSLGANTLTLAVVGPLVGYGLCRALIRLGLGAAWAVGVACALADAAVYMADAAIMSLALAGERSFGSWFALVLAGFAPAQIPLALLEGAVSVMLLRAIARRRPALLPAWMRGAARPVGLVAAAGAFTLALIVARPARAEPARFPGLDDVLVDTIAARGGPMPVKPPWDPGEGELHAFVLCAGFFAAGWIAGRAFERLGASGMSSEKSASRAKSASSASREVASEAGSDAPRA